MNADYRKECYHFVNTSGDHHETCRSVGRLLFLPTLSSIQQQNVNISIPMAESVQLFWWISVLSVLFIFCFYGLKIQERHVLLRNSISCIHQNNCTDSTIIMALPWSQGQTEGQITRLKLIKRQGYGRAHFDLLRQRVLHVA